MPIASSTVCFPEHNEEEVLDRDRLRKSISCCDLKLASKKERVCECLHLETHFLNSLYDHLDPKQFVDLEEIGYGNGGLVFKTYHTPTGTLAAKKIFNSRIPSENRRKMLKTELKTLQQCCSPFILHYYGAIVSEFQVALILEYMDRGSLNDILRWAGPLPEPILGKIAFNVLNGLTYLYDELNMIHRDLKPSNILLNSLGEVKLCDFGDSVELINSKAGSVVGTMAYMAPERIQGHKYSVTSDVWSLGVTMMELATGYFPFACEHGSSHRIHRRSSACTDGNGLETIAIVEMLEAIINEPLPDLDAEEFSEELQDFVRHCLIRDPVMRPTPMQLRVFPPTFKNLVHQFVAT